jgi:hypothetical protein
MGPLALGLLLLNIGSTGVGAGTAVAGAVTSADAAEQSHKDQVAGADGTVEINSQNAQLQQVNWAQPKSH